MADADAAKKAAAAAKKAAKAAGAAAPVTDVDDTVVGKMCAPLLDTCLCVFYRRSGV